GPGLEIIVNKDRFNALAPDLQAIVETAAAATAFDTLADFNFHNVESLQPLIEEGVEARLWPDDVVDAMARETWAVLADLAATDDHTSRVNDSFLAFLKKCDLYAASFDTAMLQMRERALKQL